MSTTLLPRHADLRKLAAAGAQLCGSIPVSKLERLGAELVSTDDDVAVVLDLGVDEQRLRIIGGRITARLCCICQRCLGHMHVVVDAQLSLAMVWDEEQLAALPSGVDGVIVGIDPTDLFALVEDELLLAMPFAPRHADTECAIPAALLACANEVAEAQSESESRSAFAKALSGYKKSDPS